MLKKNSYKTYRMSRISKIQLIFIFVLPIQLKCTVLQLGELLSIGLNDWMYVSISLNGLLVGKFF